MNSFKKIFNLFFPKLCKICMTQLEEMENLICFTCNHMLPYFDNQNPFDNEIMIKFKGRLELISAYSFMYYHKKGSSQKIIQQLKYKGEEELGEYIGNVLGNTLKKINTVSKIDYIIPVPIHENKLKKRGYNQMTLFGKRLSSILDINYNQTNLVKKIYSETQTTKDLKARFSNLSDSFNLIDNSLFEGKHILLIDDVISTGATIEACAKQLQKSKNLKLSIACMAFNSKS